MNLDRFIARRLMQEQEVVPTAMEAAIAAAALAEAVAELPGMPKLRVRFYRPIFPRDDETLGRYESDFRRTVWAVAGQPPTELRDTIRHEVVHAATFHISGEVDHCHDLPARFARGDRKARKRLRRGLLDRTVRSIMKEIAS